MTQSNNVSLREKALNWWNQLSIIDRSQCAKKYSIVLLGENTAPSSCQEIDEMYMQEHPTEAEVSKEEETVEQYAKNYLKKLDDESGTIWTEDNEDIVKAFIHIANWQKEKDRVLIEALLQSYKKLYDSIDSCVDLTPELLQSSKKAITKAEQYLSAEKSEATTSEPIKYEKEIHENLRSILFESWMDESDYQDLLRYIAKDMGCSSIEKMIQKMSHDIEIGIQKGVSAEQQFNLVKELFQKKNNLNKL